MLHPTIALPEQNTKVKNDLKKLKAGDTVQYKPAQGGEPRLMRVDQIGINKKEQSSPRMFVGMKTGSPQYCLETQVMRVIFKSVDNPDDWNDPNFVPED